MTNTPVGNELKTAREQKGLDIEQVSQLLKMKPTKIRDMEQDRYHQSKLDSYHIGYIKSYCTLLSLDAKIILNKLAVRGYILQLPNQSNTVVTGSHKFKYVVGATTIILALLLIEEQNSSPIEAKTTITQPFGFHDTEEN